MRLNLEVLQGTHLSVCGDYFGISDSLDASIVSSL